MAGGVWNVPSDGVMGVPVFGAFDWGQFRQVGVVQAWARLYLKQVAQRKMGDTYETGTLPVK